MKGGKQFKEANRLLAVNNSIWGSLSDEQKKASVLGRVNFLKEAAYVGHAEAQYDLACFYEYGAFINEKSYFVDKNKMRFWMIKSANNHFPPAVERIAMLYESDEVLQNLEKALEFYELYDQLTAVKMSKNRKLFLLQLEKGLFEQTSTGYYQLKKGWRKLIK